MKCVFKCLMLIFPVMLLAGLCDLKAEWVKNGTAVCLAPAFQEHPQIISDGSGGAVIVWDGYAQRIGSEGNILWWRTEGIKIREAERYYYRRIVPDGTGGAFVAWSGAYLQKIDMDGNVLWDIKGIMVCSGSWSDYSSSVVIQDGNGGAIVVCDSRIQKVNADGISIWTEDGVSICPASSQQSDHQVAADMAGGAIVVWRDFRDGRADIYAQRIDADGRLFWAEEGVPIRTGVGSRFGLQIVADGSGGAIISWRDDLGSVSKNTIMAQRIDSDGNVIWAEGGVEVTGDLRPRNHSRVISDGTGGAIITWDEWRDDYDIYAQRVNSSGLPEWGVSGIAVCAVSGSQEEPQLVHDGTGGAIITWEDKRNVVGWDVYAQRIDANGLAQWENDGIAVSLAGSNQIYPAIAPDGTGGAIITWSDYRSGEYDIFAMRLNADGLVDARDGPINLLQNYPNPFNPSTTIEYLVIKMCHVKLDVYDISGKRIACLVDCEKDKGFHTAEWDGRGSAGENVSSGVYFYRLQLGDQGMSRKMVLLK